MFKTEGISRIASITELRTNVKPLMRTVREEGLGLLIQRNGQPEAVLLPLERYDELMSYQPATEDE